jgi:hypothetical protein
MGVNATDRSRNDDILQKTRDEYDNRESESSRRKNEELKNAERRHNAEIKKLTENFEAKVADLQRRNYETLSDKDLKNQKSIDDLRHLYTEQIRRKSKEGYQDKKILSDTYKSEIENEKEIAANQRDNMSEKQTEALKERDERLTEISQQGQEKMHTAIDDNGRKLREAHDKERDVLLKSKTEAQVRNALETNELRKAYKNQLSDLQRQKDNQDKNWQQKYYDTVRTYEDNDADSAASRSDEIKAQSQNIQSHYEDALAKKSDLMDETNENFKDQVNDRINTQVRSRESQIQGLKNKLVNQQLSSERLSNLEKEHLTQAYEARMADLEQERTEYVDHMNDLVHTRVNEGRDHSDRVVREANKNYRSQMNLINTRNRDEMKLLEDQQKERLSHVESSAEKRVDKLQRIQAQNTHDLSRNYDESVEQLKEGYSARVADQRDKNLADRTQLSQVLTKRVHGIEETYQNRLENLQANYDATLSQMREDHRKELRHIENNFKTLLVDREKGHKTEKESIEQNYE